MKLSTAVVALVLLPSTISAGKEPEKTKGLKFVDPKAVSHFNGQLSRAFKAVKGPADDTAATDGDSLRHLAGMSADETCQSGLVTCQARLAECREASEDSEGEPSLLFVQMASNCELTKTGTTYTLSTDTMDDNTYTFTDRPFQLESGVPTDAFIDGFGETFSEANGGKPNAAFTFVSADTDEFEGPLVAIQVDAMESADGTVTYTLEQSASQAEGVALDDFFASSDSVSFEDCSIFIDTSATAAPCSADGGYVFCLAQHCVQPWDPSTGMECCDQLAGYQYLVGCTPTANQGCCQPAPTDNPSPAPTTDPAKNCVATAGYIYCEAQGCVRPWEPGTDIDCCNELPGYQFLEGCTPTASEGCCSMAATNAPSPDNPDDCVADGGYTYCSSQGCVRPWTAGVTQDCCNELESQGWAWLIGCTPTSTTGCCSSPGSGRRYLKGNSEA